MKREITTEGIPVKIWADDLEAATWEQTRNLANHPCSFHHVALMPDSHLGFGMPIGGVLALKNAIIPNAVGVDIGCGMCAVPTSLRRIEKKQLVKILDDLRKRIPVGFKRHESAQNAKYLPQEEPNERQFPIIYQEIEKSMKQVGTLGSGNHFVEIQKGSDGFIWIMIHSGSRNLGHTVATFYNRKAIEMNQTRTDPLPKKWQLDYLPLDSELAQDYIREMNYCVDFAFHNRKLMMKRVLEVVQDRTNASYTKMDSMINIAHNFAGLENHFDQEVWVHRKGATQAFNGQTGIIPGSQGANSFIVEGKGNPDSFMSCSHGAGRKLGRRQAIRQLSLKSEQQKLTGVLHAVRRKKDLDEAPGAYKDIAQVMRNQSDLVKVKVTLQPLACLKG